jgi:hypothetical protein
MAGRDGSYDCNGGYDLEGGVLRLNGAPVTIVHDGSGRMWFKAKEIHSFLGGSTITTTMARVHEKCKVQGSHHSLGDSKSRCLNRSLCGVDLKSMGG